MTQPPKVVLLCGDCGSIPPAGPPYQSMPAKGAADHLLENPTHEVAVYLLQMVVSTSKDVYYAQG